jgi:hypothetical protein
MSRAMPTLALILAGLALPAAPPLPKPAPSRTTVHKGKVPVTITAALAEGKAIVTLRFDQAGADVTIGFRGLDGLAVNGVSPIGKTQFRKGETLVLEVLVSPGPGRSHLAVDISGTFRGQPRLGVSTFAIGKPTPEQEKAGSANTLTTREGQRLKILPASKR